MNKKKIVTIIILLIIISVALLLALRSRGKTIEQITGVSLSEISFVEYIDITEKIIKEDFKNNNNDYKIDLNFYKTTRFKKYKSDDEPNGAPLETVYFYNKQKKILFTCIYQGDLIYINVGDNNNPSLDNVYIKTK